VSRCDSMSFPWLQTEAVNRSLHFPAASALQSSLYAGKPSGTGTVAQGSGIKSIRTSQDGGMVTSSTSGMRPVSTPQPRVDRFMPAPVDGNHMTPVSERAVSAATWLMSARQEGPTNTDRFLPPSGQPWRGDATRDADNVSVSTVGETWTLK
jgi:hypothetical protein